MLLWLRAPIHPSMATASVRPCPPGSLPLLMPGGHDGRRCVWEREGRRERAHGDATGADSESAKSGRTRTRTRTSTRTGTPVISSHLIDFSRLGLPCCCPQAHDRSLQPAPRPTRARLPLPATRDARLGNREALPSKEAEEEGRRTPRSGRAKACALPCSVRPW